MRGVRTFTGPAVAGFDVVLGSLPTNDEALSAAGVPVYAQRGRHGGFALLPGFRTELTGLNHDEALALLAAGPGRGEQVFGLGAALASAMRKVVDALPESHQATASDGARRFLVDPETDLLSRRTVADEVPGATMVEVRRAVLAGHKLRIRYAATGQAPQWRTADPIGLVTVRDRGYLLATRSGEDRTYRLSRVLAAEELLGTVLSVRAEAPDADGRPRLEVTFQDARHAEWALWQLGTDAEALAPQSLRNALRDRAATVAARYGQASREPFRPGGGTSRTRARAATRGAEWPGRCSETQPAATARNPVRSRSASASRRRSSVTGRSITGLSVRSVSTVRRTVSPRRSASDDRGSWPYPIPPPQSASTYQARQSSSPSQQPGEKTTSVAVSVT